MKKLYLALIFVFVYQFAFTQPDFIKDSLNSYILKGIKDWDVPGLSIVIVKDGIQIRSKQFPFTNPVEYRHRTSAKTKY